MFRRALSIVTVALLIVVLGVSTVAAAPAPEQSRRPGVEPGTNLKNQPFRISDGWGYKPWGGTGLDYFANWSEQTNEISMYVFNDTKRPITVTTATAMTFDFALWKDGKVVWRAASDKNYAQAVTSETFRPGEGKVYKATVPQMASGTYFIQGYFVGEAKDHPVVATYIWMKATDPLQYTIDYLAGNWFNPTPRLRLTIKNTGDKNMTLPYQYGYQVLVKYVGAKDYLGNVGIGQSLGTLEAGATRTVFVPLNGLGRGSYQVDVRSNIGTGTYKTIVSTRFYY